MSAIRDTVFGVFHMFALSKSITNTEHSSASHLLLQRLIVYVHHVLVREQFDPDSMDLPTAHVPDASTVEGTLDLFLLCIIAELGELLDPAAYRRQHRIVESLNMVGYRQFIPGDWRENFCNGGGAIFGLSRTMWHLLMARSFFSSSLFTR